MLLAASLMLHLPIDARAQRASEGAQRVQPVRVSRDSVVAEKAPLFAVSTNLLYTSASALTQFHSIPATVGVELPLGQHWSLYADYLVTAPWRAWNNNADCAELMHAGLGAKWFPWTRKQKTVLTGWYLYAGAGAGYYDFERNSKGYQGEEILGALGVGYGIHLGKHWSLDIAAGGGPLFSRYRYYEGRSYNEHLMFRYNGNLNYMGLTDAKFTIRYLFYRSKKK